MESKRLKYQIIFNTASRDNGCEHRHEWPAGVQHDSMWQHKPLVRSVAYHRVYNKDQFTTADLPTLSLGAEHVDSNSPIYSTLMTSPGKQTLYTMSHLMGSLVRIKPPLLRCLEHPPVPRTFLTSATIPWRGLDCPAPPPRTWVGLS